MSSDVILVADGFSYMGTGTHVAGTSTDLLGDMWSAFSGNFSISDAGLDGGRLALGRGTSDAQINLVSRVFTPQSKIGACFRVFRYDTQEASVVFLNDTANGYICFCGINGSGQVVLGRGWSFNPTWDTFFLQTTATVPVGSWTHIEIEVVPSTATSGSAKVWINGVLAGTVTGVRTSYSGTSCNQVTFFRTISYEHSYIEPDWLYTDFIVHKNGDQLGTLGVEGYEVQSDGATTDGTPSTGTDNYAMVDERPPDGDTTYVEFSGTAAERDEYGIGTVNSALSIVAYGVMHRIRKTATGTATVLQGVKEGANSQEVQSAAKALSESYENYTEFFDDNPYTSSPMTPSELSNSLITLEIGA